jgi:sulfatase maturation enzyme AslB (radical SAM superfamily)
MIPRSTHRVRTPREFIRWLYRRITHWLMVLSDSETPLEFGQRVYYAVRGWQVRNEAKQGWSITIETCTACNHRCVYCPVADQPFDQEVMSEAHFIRILDRLAGLPIIRISLNHYNDPFMDRLIDQRVTEIARRNLCRRIVINTNAEPITQKRLEALRPYRALLDFNINLPTVISAERYRMLHGLGDLARVLENINLLLDMKFKVRINIQSNVYSNEDDVRSVIRRYKKRVPFIEVSKSNTRASLVLERNVYNAGRLVGCSWDRPTRYIHIAVNGDISLLPRLFQAHSDGQSTKLIG